MSSDSDTLGFLRLTDSRLPRRLTGIREVPGIAAALVVRGENANLWWPVQTWEPWRLPARAMVGSGRYLDISWWRLQLPSRAPACARCSHMRQGTNYSACLPPPAPCRPRKPRVAVSTRRPLLSRLSPGHETLLQLWDTHPSKLTHHLGAVQLSDRLVELFRPAVVT